MHYVDTNVILRCLLDGPGAWHTGVEVIAEVVHVLSGVYEIARRELADTMIRLISQDRWNADQKDALLLALHVYRDTSLDLIDAWLVALHQTRGITIHTFDKQLARLTGRPDQRSL